MRVFRVLAHSFVLTVIDAGAVLAGFGAYKVSRVDHQLAIQVPVAVILAGGAFALWHVAGGRILVPEYTLHGKTEFLAAYLFAFAWFPVIFVPLHYLTQGYLTSFGNVYNMWLFMAPTNVAVLAVAYAAGRKRNPY